MRKFVTIIITLGIAAASSYAQATASVPEGYAAAEETPAYIPEPAPADRFEDEASDPFLRNMVFPAEPAGPGWKDIAIYVLIIAGVIVIGIALGLVILHSGKLFHRMNDAERRLYDIEDKLHLNADDPESPGRDFRDMIPDFDELDDEQKAFVTSALVEKGFIRMEDAAESADNGNPLEAGDPELNGDFEHDDALIRRWIKMIDEAFDYEIAPPGKGEYFPRDHFGPNGENGKAWALYNIFNGTCTSEADVTAAIRRYTREDAIRASTARSLESIYGHPIES